MKRDLFILAQDTQQVKPEDGPAMDESTLLLARLLALFLLMSLIYAKKNPPTALLFDTRPLDFAVTIWAESGTERWTSNCCRTE